ncbi:hypothetical protein K491DRAFT_685119 [Lophiostoma macrostomum CBS 122681]|uniref:Uncharacterized protein n=1 Tax=Lophiostoma macrostomum CBS 122681 TaxID=1314788 RepID=A0A6A6SKI1_9PLEO|nr:hypothetical protein K491DRAFT_685119 [Lophiostoma macrostomum CBS 122681]
MKEEPLRKRLEHQSMDVFDSTQQFKSSCPQEKKILKKKKRKLITCARPLYHTDASKPSSENQFGASKILVTHARLFLYSFLDFYFQIPICLRTFSFHPLDTHVHRKEGLEFYVTYKAVLATHKTSRNPQPPNGVVGCERNACDQWVVVPSMSQMHHPLKFLLTRFEIQNMRESKIQNTPCAETANNQVKAVQSHVRKTRGQCLAGVLAIQELKLKTSRVLILMATLRVGKKTLAAGRCSNRIAMEKGTE